MAYTNWTILNKMMESAVTAFSDEKLYLIAYQWVTTVTRPPWWAFWREPIVTRIEVQQPGRVECDFEMGKDQFGNPTINVIKTGSIPWAGVSKIHVVTDKGTEIAYLPSSYYFTGE